MSFDLTSQLGVANSSPGWLSPGLVVSEDDTWVYAQPTSPTDKTFPFIARVFDFTGTQFITSFGLRDIPQIKYTMPGSSQPISLPVDDQAVASLIALGSIIQLAEQGGDQTILYTGTVESLPISYGDDTEVSLELDPLGAELGKTAFDKDYATAVDVGQWVLDAVAQTAHLWATPQSVPMTGVVESYQFNNTHVADVLDTALTTLGPTYFYWVSPMGQVWLQPQRTVANYIVSRMQDFNVSKTAKSIASLKNLITVVGAVDSQTGATLTSSYSNPISQGQYGIRKLQPNPSFPEAATQSLLDRLSITLGAALDRVTQGVMLNVVGYPLRLWPGQPGGAVVSFWEPLVSPMPQSIGGTGTYSDPLFVRDLTIAGPSQAAILDQVPLGVDDLTSTLNRIVGRQSSASIVYAPAPLNQPATLTPSGSLSAQNGQAGWKFDAKSIRAYDGSKTDYGAPSGAGVTVEIAEDGTLFAAKSLIRSSSVGNRLVVDGTGNIIRIFDTNEVERVSIGTLAALGISPAQEGIRVCKSDGTPIFDTLGLFNGVMQELVLADSGVINQTFTGALTASPVTGASIAFSVARDLHCLIFYTITLKQTATTGGFGYVNAELDGVSAGADHRFALADGATFTQAAWMRVDPASLAGSPHTARLTMDVDAGSVVVVRQASIKVFQLGS